MWSPHLIFRDIRLPGDFALKDLDRDGDLDWIGTTLTSGQAYIVEQYEPEAGLVARISLPDGFDARKTKLLVSLARDLPLTGIPVAVLATIDNVDSESDGELDLDQVLSPSRDFVPTLDDVGIAGDYHLVVALYVEGGGQFQPVPGVDYQANSERLTFGQGTVRTSLELVPTP